jgi:pectate lyase
MAPRQTERPPGAVARRAAGWIGVIAIAAAAPLMPAAIPAFPGAEGFGADTPGGRGGKVYVVTTSDDQGRGSLREAVGAEGPRIVVFGISGDIAGRAMDAISIGSFGASGGVSNVVVDHCSASWASDETISVAGPSRNLTVQWCILAECLSRSVHREGEHSKGSIIGGQGEGVSFHHNIYAHIGTRNPKAGSDHLPPEPGVTIDFVNNVIYDWGPRAGYGAEQRVRLNYVCNWLRAGPSTASVGTCFGR